MADKRRSVETIAAADVWANEYDALIVTRRAEYEIHCQQRVPGADRCLAIVEWHLDDFRTLRLEKGAAGLRTWHCAGPTVATLPELLSAAPGELYRANVDRIPVGDPAIIGSAAGKGYGKKLRARDALIARLCKAIAAWPWRRVGGQTVLDEMAEWQVRPAADLLQELRPTDLWPGIRLREVIVYMTGILRGPRRRELAAGLHNQCWHAPAANCRCTKPVLIVARVLELNPRTVEQAAAQRNREPRARRTTQAE